MATASEVKAGLDDIATQIRGQRAALVKAIGLAQAASAALTLIANDYSGVIATVNGYGTTDPFESLSKAELAKLTTEFVALKGDADMIAAVVLD
jgi:hypothetical protein